jgi:hypothetical protein
MGGALAKPFTLSWALAGMDIEKSVEALAFKAII